ncbi:hypothetical protein M011DRAFT_487403 [Sporormia fimetaria CBS 119925]|uniref:Homeobox domain-containing protein n=1 Tax=Sporormia fimetaria CBS 119925 TaxID=1340428 RepID=A0A6A6V985_9PLEO|nr:hypothetical protein M011DRAFT_487403 [Sporormia fimetaria CBS 119925]
MRWLHGMDSNEHTTYPRCRSNEEWLAPELFNLCFTIASLQIVFRVSTWKGASPPCGLVACKTSITMLCASARWRQTRRGSQRRARTPHNIPTSRLPPHHHHFSHTPAILLAALQSSRSLQTPRAMSTSSPPASSSASSASPHAALAFLVHSPNTVANHLPPDVDNRPLARQKRRRTSKEDEEILKAEYLKNPKPDKAARLELVSKVALGEKEVQIWFQNKRQNDRRRNRPLGSSPSALMSDSSTMSDPVSEEGCNPPERDGESGEREEVTRQPEEAAPDAAPAVDTSIPVTTETQSTTDTTSAAFNESVDAHTTETAPTEPSSQQTAPGSQGTSNSSSLWISNRRSASFRCTEEYAAETIAFPAPAPAPAPTTAAAPASASVEDVETSTRSLRRVHSYVRLSMTGDGTARVVTEADKTPSPPHKKPSPRPVAGLRRSYSAAGLNERLAAAARIEPSPKIPRTGSATAIGRSRDSRNWEFWCDPETRNSNSLTAKAEQEGSGSAADAIELLRASRRVLSQNQIRQNTTLSRSESAKVGGNGVKRPRGPIQRASTSYGRLQTKKHGGKADKADDDLPQTESDKENWEPNMPKQHRQRHAPSSQRQKQVLGENKEILSASFSSSLRGKRKSGAMPARENSDPEMDDELRTFMSGGDMSGTNLSTAEEAGCVEGLLKLSQGNWSMFNDANTSDFTVYALAGGEEKEIHVHKRYLCELSPVFRAFLEPDSKEIFSFMVAHQPYHVMSAFLRYFYTTTWNHIAERAMPWWEVLDLLKLADVHLCHHLDTLSPWIFTLLESSQQLDLDVLLTFERYSFCILVEKYYSRCDKPGTRIGRSIAQLLCRDPEKRQKVGSVKSIALVRKYPVFAQDLCTAFLVKDDTGVEAPTDIQPKNKRERRSKRSLDREFDDYLRKMDLERCLGEG